MNNAPISVVFFGSFLHYSALVLESLIASDYLRVEAVVTTPPLVDSKGEHKNPVQLMAEQNDIPVFTPENLTDDSLNELRSLWCKSVISHSENNQNFMEIPDRVRDNGVGLFVTAGYGKLLPENWLSAPKIASLNMHLSLLPDYRGANPGEWALLMGEKESGVTLIEMSPRFDTGKIIATHSIPITDNDDRESLYQKLYQRGGEVLPDLVRTYVQYKLDTNATKLQQLESSATQLHLPPIDQPSGNHLYARRLNRDDGFISWQALSSLMAGKPLEPGEWSLYDEMVTKIPKTSKKPPTAPVLLARATRALKAFPSLWTEITTRNGTTRMKILNVDTRNGKLVLKTVHLSGKQPTPWNEVKNVLVEKKLKRKI